MEHECVLVRDETRKLTGIVTTADLSLQFRDLGEPFLLLGQIESHVRNLIADKYHKAELIEACDPSDAGRQIRGCLGFDIGRIHPTLGKPKEMGEIGCPQLTGRPLLTS